MTLQIPVLLINNTYKSEYIIYNNYIHIYIHGTETSLCPRFRKQNHYVLSKYIYFNCITVVFNIITVELLDTLHFESESLLPLVEIEHRSDFWQWPLRVQHRVGHV